jgi:sortase A
VPDSTAVGWHDTSAGVGQSSNTVLNGHHNLYGQVFRRLVELEVGNTLSLWVGETEHLYMVTETTILPERGQPIEVRLANAEHILPTDDERITLVTCWPYSGNSHRLVVVAKPIPDYDLFFE